MFAAALKIARRTAAVNQQSVRSVTHGVGYPRRRMPLPEKAAHGVVIALALIAIPAYIAVNIKHYRGDTDE